MPADEAALRRMHAGDGFEYALPNLADPRLWIARPVLEGKDGAPAMALLGRLTSEVYLLQDPALDWTPARRMRGVLRLAEAACAEGRSMGIDTCHAWLPPEIVANWGAKLERLGWRQAAWPAFVREL